MTLAATAKRTFVTARNRQLALVAGERRTSKQAIAALRKTYDKLVSAYLSAQSTTYADWIEHGAKPELDEVIAAAEDPAIWDRLVDKHTSTRSRENA